MNKKTSTGLQENVAGLLCYLFGWITGLIFFLVEKNNKFVRFHAMQSMILFGGLFVLQIVIGIFMTLLAIIHLGILVPLVNLINSLVFLASFILWIILMIKAYQGEKYMLPVIGELADNNI